MSAEDKSGQSWNATTYGTHCRFVADLGAPVLDLLGPIDGQDILDLGCGDGALTQKLAEAGARVIGVDAAPDMIAATLRRGLAARLMDAEDLAFERPFDAVFTNAALHWMTRPDRVIAAVQRNLKRGGRFVGEFGGFGNVAAVRVAINIVLADYGIDGNEISPWYFPTAGEYTARLERGGFVVDQIALIGRPTPIGTSLAAWLDNFGQVFFHALSPRVRVAALDRVVALLAPLLRDETGAWTVDYVRLRFAAHLPE
jgi:SAM-dependent methyltransferase